MTDATRKTRPCETGNAQCDTIGTCFAAGDREALRGDALQQGWIGQHPVVFAICNVCLIVLFVSFVISWWSGWALLAKKFPAQEPFRGKRRSWVSGQFRWAAGYNNCLTVGANPEGLYISVWFLPFFHPPLFIPWTEIRVSGGRWFLLRSTRFELGNDLHLPLRLFALFRDIGDDLKQDAGSGWPSGSAAPPF